MPLLSTSWLPSAGKNSRFSFVATGLATPADAYIGYGIAASTPATWAALSSSNAIGVTNVPESVITRGPGVGSVTGSIDSGSIGAAGNLAWIVLLPSYPSGGTVPLAVSGPYAVAA